MALPLKQLGVVAAIAVVVGAGGSYVYYDRYGRYLEETNDAIIQADQVGISSKLAGYVRAVAVEDNQRVNSGDLLVEIDPVDYETRLSAAEAEIASAVAAERANDATLAETIAGVDVARANLRVAEANLAFATREVKRHRPLVAAKLEPASVLSQVTANHDRALAEAASVRASLAQAQKRVNSIRAQRAQMAAQLQSARVRQEAATNDLKSTGILAPITGKVASRSARVGQFVQPGVRLMTLVPERDLYVIANFKETQLGLMRAGQPALVRADALPDVAFAGMVTSITPGTGANFSLIPPQNATGNFTKIVQRVPVRIRIEAGPAARRVLVPGLSLEVEVDTRSAYREIDEIRSEQKAALR